MLRHRIAGPAIAVGLLVVLVQSAEFTEAAAESGLVDPEILIDEGLRAPLTNMDPPPPPDAAPPTPAVSAQHQQLIDDVEKIDPQIAVEPTDLQIPVALPPNEAQAQLTAQLGAMTDADGKSVITGTMPDPANTTISVESDMQHEYPAGDDDAANAMMAGNPKSGGQLEPAAARPKFRPIPYFKFAHDGTVRHGYSQMECQQTCADDEKCMSYSFNEMESACITSASCVQYDLEFDFFAKQGGVEGTVRYRHLGAMKYLYTGKGDAGVTSHAGKTKAFCEENCKKNPGCKSFCFRQRDKLCLTSTQDLGYEQGWNYYEKAGASVKVAEAAIRKPSTATTKDLQKEFSGNGTAAAAKETSITDVATEDATPSISKQIVDKENAALSEEQLQYMKENMPEDKSPQTAAATVTAALTDRTAQLTAAEAARVEVAKKVAAKAKALTETKLGAEMKGKKLYESEMRATDDKVRFALETGSKTAWKASETNAKTEELNKESTQKQNREDEAELERQKTATETSKVAQEELEASDDVNELEGRKKLYKEAVDHFNELDVKSIQKLQFLKKEQSRAAVMLAEAKKREKLNEYETDRTNAEKDIDEQQKIQIQKADAIKLADEKIPDLMREKSDGEIAEQEAQNEKAQAELAAQGATTNTEVTSTQKAIADADAKLADAQSTVTKSTTELNTLKQQVSQGHTLIAESKSKEETSEAVKNKAAYEFKTLKEHLDKLETDGGILLESSKFQKSQTVNNEFSIKTTLANKMKEELDFEEGDSKKKLKLKDLKLQLEELEVAGKEQDVEKKVKIAVTFTEKSTKAEVNVDNKVKSAKADEERSVKMLSKAKLAAAEAITTEQKVDAAKQESEAGMLKVSSEQQMVALEPDLQKAKEAEMAAQDKLQALKDMFKDDEAAYKKAMGMFNSATSALAKAKLSGALDVVKKETAFQVKLEEKAAMAQGINNIMKGYVSNGTASERASNALNKLSEQDIKLGKKSKVIDQVGKGGAQTVEQHIAHEKKIKSDIAIVKAREANIKKAIAEASKQNVAFNDKKLEVTAQVATATATQERESKETKVEEMKISSEEEKSVKKHETQMVKTQEQTQKSAAVAATQKEAGDKTVLKLSSHKNGYGCDVSDDGKPMNLEQKERCSKDKSSTLEDQEKQAKADAKQRESDIKLQEKEEKDSEKQEKQEGKQKASKKEKDSKESQEKEKSQKEEMTETEQKENKKKTDEEERLSKESHTKKVEREETNSKEEEKKTSEKNEKENQTKEAETKSKEKNGKEQEKATKEKTQKDGQTEKEKKESQNKIKEQNEKTQESETKESASKSEDEKADKESETKEQTTKAQEKDTKEKAEKGDAESETKTKEHTTKAQAAEKEKETKAAETKAQEQASKEKATKDQEKEGTAKESAKKTEAQQTQATESTQKTNANEGTQKVNAQQASAGAAAANLASGGVTR